MLIEHISTDNTRYQPDIAPAHVIADLGRNHGTTAASRGGSGQRESLRASASGFGIRQTDARTAQTHLDERLRTTPENLLLPGMHPAKNAFKQAGHSGQSGV